MAIVHGVDNRSCGRMTRCPLLPVPASIDWSPAGGRILPMELSQVTYFVTLAHTLHFTKAAEACNVSPPALTKAVRRLEDELGGPLLHRERGHTQLTDPRAADAPAIGDALWLRPRKRNRRRKPLGAAKVHRCVSGWNTRSRPRC